MIKDLLYSALHAYLGIMQLLIRIILFNTTLTYVIHTTRFSIPFFNIDSYFSPSYRLHSPFIQSKPLSNTNLYTYQTAQPDYLNSFIHLPAMSFLYPSFLWGLIALSIPIIVHLFNFRRAKKVYFSNVAFLENVKQRSSSKLKIKYLLVLACRLLVIAFLVFAFAQPFIPGKEKGLDGTNVKIYLDNSQSSSNITDNDLSGLNTGISFMEEIINLYPSQSHVQLRPRTPHP